MAAIIAQLSIANRRRKKRQRETKWIESDKCVYSLPPFDPCFQPMKHNKYLKNKVEFERRQFIAQKAKARVLKFQQMDNWEKVDRAFKSKVGDGKLQKCDPEAPDGKNPDYVHAYKEELRRMSAMSVSNAFISAALLPTGVPLPKPPTSVSYEQENENLIRGSLKADYVVENKYRCDDNRREQQYTPRQRACKKLLDEKTNVGKFTEICAAAMAILAIAIFTGIFLFLLIMFSNLETPTDDAVTPQLLGHTTPESSNAQLSFLIDANDG